MARRTSQAISGEGARRRGGRWNLQGTRMVYCADSRSLATLEVMVHVEDVAEFAAQSWVVIPVTVPPQLIEKPARFPAAWRAVPYTTTTQVFGTEWVQTGRRAVLRVPSVVVPGEFNYLLNPFHPDFARIKVGKPQPFRFDPRLA